MASGLHLVRGTHVERFSPSTRVIFRSQTGRERDERAVCRFAQISVPRCSVAPVRCRALRITPDLLVTAKGISNGYIPMGAVLIGDRVMEMAEGTTFWHGFTYDGHPVGAAVELANVDIIEREGLLEWSTAMGKRLYDAVAARSKARRRHCRHSFASRTSSPMSSRHASGRTAQPGRSLWTAGPTATVSSVRTIRSPSLE